jgi:CRP-like cAMP-binding protein
VYLLQGEEGQEMYLISSGECEVLVESRSLAQPSRGRMEYAIAERGPGQYIGEMALSTDPSKLPPKRTASIRAKTHVVTLVVSRDQVCSTVKALNYIFP